MSQQQQPLPDSARGRLAQSQQGRPCFTSDLSVSEFFAMGTAVSRLHQDASPESPQMTMPLSG
jgi:hypothetical protein